MTTPVTKKDIEDMANKAIASGDMQLGSILLALASVHGDRHSLHVLMHAVAGALTPEEECSTASASTSP